MANDSEKKTTNQKNIEEMEVRANAVNAVSPSLCLAKWLQSTVYLHTGMTHSCHHPSPHKVPLDELRRDPSALHNTPTKLLARQEMMKGKRPKECHYCWNIEDLKEKRISDRIYKSTDKQWAFPHLNEIVDSPLKSVNPTYLEVAFEHTCNFKCAYCSPDISTKWMDEIQRHGPYPTSSKTGNLDWLKSSGRMPIAKSEENPYVDAFWEWWPELYQKLNTFRITGGEPLLSKNTWRVLDYVEKNPREDFHLAINTNMGVPPELIDRLIDYHNRLQGKLKSFEIYTSCEAHGKAAEYIRYGLDYPVFLQNIEKFLNNTQSDSRMNLMITFNALSAPSFPDFLKDIWKLRKTHNEKDSLNRIPMMIAYLRWPTFLSMRILPEEVKSTFAKRALDLVNQHSRAQEPNGVGRFYLEEIDQVKRLVEFMRTELPAAELQKEREDFRRYILEYDRRKQLDFSQTFPELTSMLSD